MRIADLLDAGLAIAKMGQNQWKTRAELESIQADKLRRLIWHASRNVPHYKKALQEFAPAGIRDLEALRALPVLSKEEIRKGGASFIRSGCREESMMKYSTTGTTGESLCHYMDRRDGIYGSALRQHSFMQCGVKPRERILNLAFSQLRFPFQPVFFRVETLAPEPDAGRFHAAVKSLSPDVLYAYPSLLQPLAEHNLASGKALRVRKAICVSEVLRPQARKAIAESFGCDVRNYYGASECWCIAWECEEGSMHVNSDSVVVEAVDDCGHPVREGASGDLLITPLWRHSMPFIRYGIGDRGTLGSGCRCGRGLHIIKSLDGRAVDYLTLPSGRRYPWILMEIPSGHADRIVSYQAIQESPERLEIRIIPCRGTRPGIEERVKAGIQAKLPEKMDVHVETVDHIPPGSRGKKPDFISRIKRSY